MKAICYITVFTATYNRKNLLGNIYEDLKNQTYKNFQWLIVDDGSTDETRSLVSQWKDENIINIRYIYKENGGRHSAINIGVENAQGELFLLLDSDDSIINTCLQQISEIWHLYGNSKEIAGILTLSKNKNGLTIGSEFPNECSLASFSDVYYKYKVNGDKCTCFVTDILKKFKFPEKDGIKFVMESVVWDEISKKYKMICRNEILQIVDYQIDGLSRIEYSFNKINGLAFSYLTMINNKTYSLLCYTKRWIWSYIFLIAYSRLYKLGYYKDLNRYSSKMCYLLFLPAGYYLYIKINRHIKPNNISLEI